MNENLNLVHVLKKFPEIHIAILFGSMASGTADAHSDIDLAISFSKPMTIEQKTQLISSLAEATGRPVDIIDLRSVGEPMLGQILHHGKRLIGADCEYAELLSKHLGNEADFMPYYRRLLKQRRKTWIGM